MRMSIQGNRSHVARPGQPGLDGPWSECLFTCVHGALSRAIDVHGRPPLGTAGAGAPGGDLSVLADAHGLVVATVKIIFLLHRPLHNAFSVPIDVGRARSRGWSDVYAADSSASGRRGIVAR